MKEEQGTKRFKKGDLVVYCEDERYVVEGFEEDDRGIGFVLGNELSPLSGSCNHLKLPGVKVYWSKLNMATLNFEEDLELISESSNKQKTKKIKYPQNK